MRIAVIYDCLYPHTVGGAERWYRDLAEHLAARHQVTYLTRRQWGRNELPDAPRNVEVIAVSGGRRLYTTSGRRRISTPLRFGAGVLRHLLKNRRRYDVVHTCGFPHFAPIAARLARSAGGAPVLTDWLEVWPPEYWRDYLGPIGGSIGAAVQRLAIRLTDRALVFSELGAMQIRDAGYRGEPIRLEGLYAGGSEPADGVFPREPLVVFAGRHIPEKRVSAIPAAIALARKHLPELRAIVFGDGPERPRLLAEIDRLGLEGAVKSPGFRPWEEVSAALRGGLCLLLPSTREGYGLVIVEAAARGAPALVTRAPGNAATELVEEGVNGCVLADAEPATLAEAILRVHATREELGASTRAWFARNAQRLSIESSVARLEKIYAMLVNRPGIR